MRANFRRSMEWERTLVGLRFLPASQLPRPEGLGQLNRLHLIGRSADRSCVSHAKNPRTADGLSPNSGQEANETTDAAVARRALLLGGAAAALTAACASPQEIAVDPPGADGGGSLGAGVGADGDLGAAPQELPFQADEPNATVEGGAAEGGTAEPTPQPTVADEFNSRDGFVVPEMTDEEIQAALAEYRDRVRRPDGSVPDGSDEPATQQPQTPNQPADQPTPVPNQPTAGPAQPTATPVPAQPTATPVPGQPDPTPTPVPPGPTSTPVPGQPDPTTPPTPTATPATPSTPRPTRPPANDTNNQDPTATPQPVDPTATPTNTPDNNRNDPDPEPDPVLPEPQNNVARLAQRATFGATPQVVAAIEEQGYEGWLDNQLGRTGAADPSTDQLVAGYLSLGRTNKQNRQARAGAGDGSPSIVASWARSCTRHCCEQCTATASSTKSWSTSGTTI